VFTLAAGCVGIPAQQARRREFLLHHLFKPFGSQAQLADLAAATLGAFFGHLAGVITQMADQVLPRSMMHQRLVISRAAQRIAALAAKNVGCFAAAVQKKDCLLPGLQRLGKLVAQRLGKHAAVAGAQLQAHIHHVHFRQLQREQFIRVASTCDLATVRQDAVGQAQQFHFSPTSVKILGDARGGAAQDQIRAAELRQGFGCSHGVIERLSLGLIVGVVVTFIDGNQAQFG